MKHWRKVSLTAALFLALGISALAPTDAHAQMWGGGHGHDWWAGGRWGGGVEQAEPDTITGTLVKWQNMMGWDFYGVDADGDGRLDVYLNLGPMFSPDSLPESGTEVTVVGWLVTTPMAQMMMVQSVNGYAVRPVPDWHHEGWEWLTSEDSVTVTGTVLADTLFDTVFLYLDEDGDGLSDYYLNFGPPWYSPENGATRPEPGQEVAITGLVRDVHGINVLIVLAVDGQPWRDPVGPPPWSGRWIRSDEPDTIYVTSPWDSLLEVVIPPGAFHGMGHHGGNRIFCQILPAQIDSLPAAGDSVAMGWYFRLLENDGHHLAGRGRMVRFAHKLRLRVRIPTGQPGSLGKVANTGYALRVWNQDSGTWETLAASPSGVIEGELESINSEYLAVFETSTATGVAQSGPFVPDRTELRPNYPNPFNPSTEIVYRLGGSNSRRVKLVVYDLSGRLVATLVDGVQAPGEYRLRWSARDAQGSALAAGVYLLRLEAGDVTQTQRMIFLK